MVIMPIKKNINIDKKSKEYKRLYQRFYYYKRRLNIEFIKYHKEYYLKNCKFKKKTDKKPVIPKEKKFKYKSNVYNIPSEKTLTEGILIFE